MGSIITLGINNFEIDWGKNDRFVDHSPLFLPSDVRLIPYYYADDTVKMREGLSRELGAVKRRLDLLGYFPKLLSKKYQEHLNMVPGHYPEITISFEQFRSIVTSIDIEKVSRDSEDGDYDLGEFVSQYVFRDPEVQRHLPAAIDINMDIGTFFENLDPYITLRLLAENERNKHRLLQWRYADEVDRGWVDRDKVVAPLSDESRILIVTEGSSDSFIIQRAMAALCPDIADFFYFVNMEKHYPFTGTGNLFNFCQGLSRIRIRNNVLVVFDNDAAGIEKYQQSRELSHPRNITSANYQTMSILIALKPLDRMAPQWKT